jgi:hypothetical protein
MGRWGERRTLNALLPLSVGQGKFDLTLTIGEQNGWQNLPLQLRFCKDKGNPCLYILNF